MNVEGFNRVIPRPIMNHDYWIIEGSTATEVMLNSQEWCRGELTGLEILNIRQTDASGHKKAQQLYVAGLFNA